MKKIMCLIGCLILFIPIFSQSLQLGFDYPKQFFTFPKSSQDSSDVFSERGAWFGYSLPLENDIENYGKFGGPYCLYSEKWLAESMLKFKHSLEGGGVVKLQTAKDVSFKIEDGILYQKFTFDDYFIELKLSIVSTRVSLFVANLVNTSDKKIKLSMQIEGELFPDNGSGEKLENGWLVNFEEKAEIMWVLQLNLDKNMEMDYSKTHYSVGFEKKQEVNPNDTLQIIATLSQLFAGDSSKELQLTEKVLKNPDEFFNNNMRSRQIMRTKTSLLDTTYQDLALNCIKTININQRSYLPSLADFRCLRGAGPNSQEVAVDEAWMLVVSIMAFDLPKAKSHLFYLLREMNDDNSLNKYLTKDGKNTPSKFLNEKPMAAWTAWNLYKINSNKIFLSLVFEKLEAYHNYWYSERNVDKNLWCENSDGIETVALNAMLFVEKRCLRDIANILEDTDKVKKYEYQIFEMGLEFNSHFLDPEFAEYHDIHLSTNTKIPSDGALEYSLWSGLILPEIANHFVAAVEENIELGNLKKWLKSNKTDLESFYFLRLGLISYGREDLAEKIKDQVINEYLNRLNNKKIIYYDFETGKEISNSSFLSALLLMFLFC